MLQIPSGLTAEEKQLRKTYEFVKNIRKTIENAQKAQHLGTTAAKKSTNGNEDLDHNMAEVKKKLAKGVIKVAKDEKHTFKRIHGQKREFVNYVDQPINIDVEPAPSSSDPISAKSTTPETQNTNLYIRGFELDYDLIRETFSQFGYVVRCYIEEHKRAGFINFSTPEEAEKALQMNGQRVGQSNLRVEYARKRDNTRRYSQSHRYNAEETETKRVRTDSNTSDRQRAMVSYEDGEIFD
ncbi:unnamed protein product [Bursaphelenchus xylophilus]|uniref:Negative elongation factor E n=1 Tax=Bursaphelenchus xylophilus TaxID=6326 RepID=A0A1I7SLT5_BURXY|nr:unnamed protein product [Bursaphelenchus xylophilus]CAG9129824.1 unnamed protein product [Bursaphelenchus xylophilus]